MKTIQAHNAGLTGFINIFPNRQNGMVADEAGWECPRCHRIYSKRVSECKKCNQDIEVKEKIYFKK